MKAVLATTTALTLLFALESRMALGQSLLTSGSMDTDTAEIEELVVTGTRTRGRTLLESIVPVDKISSESLQKTASNDVIDKLTLLVPSFKVRNLPTSDGNQFVRPASLRGLSPDHTLVLINGKRRHRSAFLNEGGSQPADLAQIPALAISRIEVLRDGASAQYGSDAIAGVINIILDDAPGLSAFGQFSQYYEGDGDTYQSGIRGGMSLENGGYLVGTFEWADADPTSRSRQRPDAIAFQAAHPELSVADPVQRWGKPDRESFRFVINSMVPVREGIDFYLFATHGEADGSNDFNWRNPDTNSAFNPSPTVFPDFDLRDIFPTGFTPRFGQEDKDFSVNAGLKGELFERLSWDISTSVGRNLVDFFIDNTINASFGPDSPTFFRPGILIQREENFNVDFVLPFNLPLLTREVNLAFGMERRDETYTIRAGDPFSWGVGPAAVDGLPSGSNGFPGFSEDQAGWWDQVNYAGYGDIEIPLLERLTISGALRHESFDSFGSSTTGKVGGRFEIAEPLAVRGGYSTAFRAPTPGQLNATRTSQGLDTRTLQLFTNGRLSPLNPVARAFGATPLRPEKSRNASAGVVFDWRNISASIDLYRVKVRDRLSTSPSFTITDDIRNDLIAQNIPGAESFTQVSFFTNDFDTRTQGVDIVVSSSFDVLDGDLTFTGAYSYNQTRVTGGALSASEFSRSIFERRFPNHTGNFTLDFKRNRFDGFFRVRYFGQWTDSADQATGDIFQDFGSELVFDVGATIWIRPDLFFRAGAENVFDNTPDEATFQASRGLIFSRNSPNDFNGGLLYTRLGFDF